jgi:chromosome segregation ATPase
MKRKLAYIFAVPLLFSVLAFQGNCHSQCQELIKDCRNDLGPNSERCREDQKKFQDMGPMAEDFFKAFRLGTGNTSIGVQDLAGVSLAAIKELDKRTVEVDQLRDEVNQLRQANSDLERRLAILEQLLKLH